MILLEKKPIRFAAYSLFFFFVFALAASFSFPDKQVKEIASVKIQQLIGPKYKVRISDVDLSILTLGATIEGITIEEHVEDEEEPIDEDAPAELPMKVTLNSMSVRFAPIHSVMNLGLAVKAVVDLGGGDVVVYFTKQFDGQKLDVMIDDLDLQPSKTPIILGYLGVPMFGTLDGDAELYINDKGFPTKGQISLKGTQITVGPATVKTDKFPPITYLEIPSTSFGGLNMEMDIRNEGASKSYVDFTQVGISGRDIRGETWGYIALGRDVGRSEAKLKMRMQLDETFVKKNNLTSLLTVNEVRKGKNKNWYGFSLSGALRKIRFKGSTDAATGPIKSPIEIPTSKKKTSSKEKKADVLKTPGPLKKK